MLLDRPAGCTPRKGADRRPARPLRGVAPATGNEPQADNGYAAK
jgi:hypothetical protein